MSGGAVDICARRVTRNPPLVWRTRQFGLQSQYEGRCQARVYRASASRWVERHAAGVQPRDWH